MLDFVLAAAVGTVVPDSGSLSAIMHLFKLFPNYVRTRMYGAYVCFKDFPPNSEISTTLIAVPANSVGITNWTGCHLVVQQYYKHELPKALSRSHQLLAGRAQ